MTPIGHFISCAAVGSVADLTSERETAWCAAYYVLFLAVFGVCAHLMAPGMWAMYLHDWFGNAALIFFLVAWGRAAPRQQAFVCLLIGAQILAAYTHLFDTIALKTMGMVPEGMWRPHNILHAPLAAVVVSFIATPLVRLLTKGLSFTRVFFFCAVGYVLHILMDTMTYQYGLYVLWPVSDMRWSLISVFQQPDAVSRWLGNPLYMFEPPSVHNIDGFIVYMSEVALNVLLALLVVFKYASRRLSSDRTS